MARFQWQKGFDGGFILSTIAGFRRPTPDGCSYDAVKYQFWLPILQSAIRADGTAREVKARCVTKALNDPTLALDDREKFLERCETAFAEIAKTALTHYVLFCTTTYKGPSLFGKAEDNGRAIQWDPAKSSAPYKKALLARQVLFKESSRPEITKEDSNLTPVLVHVDALSPQDGYELATRSVDCLRGLLNFFANSRRSLNVFAKLSGRDVHAVNRFRPGPCATMHKADGSLATQTIWYEPRWSHEKPPIKFGGDAQANRKRIMRWWSRLQSSPIREWLVEGLVRYCRALDQHDADSALLGLWSALEILTATQIDGYEKTVARVTKVFDDHIEARQIAQHLRIRRNSTVHAGRSPDSNEVDAVILQAELLVARLLSFYLSEGKRFRNQAELIEFLDLDINHAHLKRSRAIIDHFISYRNRA